MAQTYSGIDGFNKRPPCLTDFRCNKYVFDIDAYNQALDVYEQDLREHVRSVSPCEDAGEILRFPIEDGLARYMLFDYQKLIYLPKPYEYQAMDATIRGLRVCDVKQMLNDQRALEDVFKAALAS